MLKVCETELTPEADRWLRDMFYQFGDPRINEATHKYIRELIDRNLNKKSVAMSRFLKCMRAPVLKERTKDSATTIIMTTANDMAAHVSKDLPNSGRIRS